MPVNLHHGLAMAMVFFSIVIAGEAAQDKTEPANVEASKSPFAGSEACQLCHEDLGNAFGRNLHHELEESKKGKWAGKSCESCHGPGAKHADSTLAADILNPGKMPAGKANAACLTCHKNEETHLGRIAGSHARSEVSCTACHAMHQGSAKVVARNNAAINAQCGSCHGDVLAKFNQPYGHKILQNAMSCADCHNPHGTFQKSLTRLSAGNEPGCLSCHGDKRGPFAFEHAPVQLEGCNSCHAPHGSANPRLLNRHEVRFNCLECHANGPVLPTTLTSRNLGVLPPALHDLKQPQYRNCTVCHVKVHGSNTNKDFLR